MLREFMKMIKTTILLWKYWRNSILIYDEDKEKFNKEKPSEIFIVYRDQIQQVINERWQDVPSDIITYLEFFIKRWKEENAKNT